MTIFLMASEVGSITPLSASSFETTTGTTEFDPTYARASYFSEHSAALSRTFAFAGQTSGYIRFHFAGVCGAASPVYPVVLADASNVSWVRFGLDPGGTQVRLEYYTGTAWVVAGVATVAGANFFDIYWLGGSASGRVQLFAANSLVVDSGVVSTSAMQAITHLNLSGANPNQSLMSEIIGATVPTIGWRLATLYPTGNGANTAWVGDYTAVDEITYSDADFISSASNGDIETYTMSDPTLSTNLVKGVGVAARAKCDATGPQNLQHVVRVGSTNYPSASHALNVGYDSYVSIWETSPATSTTWTSTEINALEAGVKAIT